MDLPPQRAVGSPLPVFRTLSAMSDDAPCTALDRKGLGTYKNTVGPELLLVALPEDSCINFCDYLILIHC